MLTVTEAFTEFQRRYAPTRMSEEIASGRQVKIRGALSQRLDITEDFLIGSYKKQTQIKPARDVDIFLVLDKSHWSEEVHKTPKRSLVLIFRNIRKTFPRTRMKADNQAVQVRFTDNYTFDLVPAFSLNQNGYIIPSVSSGGWVACNPKVNMKFLTETNQQMSNMLTPLVKMVKCWNRKHEVRFKSFHVELLVANSMLDLSDKTRGEFGRSYPEFILNFFHYACRKIYQPMYDEVNIRIDGYLDKKMMKSQVWNKLQKSLQLAHQAWRLEQLNRVPQAIRAWRGIFGAYFPEPGV